MMTDEFDPDSIMNATITKEEYEGKKTLTPEGAYPNSKIEDVRAFEPHERQKEKGVEARLMIKFVCPTDDVDLTHFVNFKRPLNSRATYTKLVKAVWTDQEEALIKTPRDLVGQTVNINVFHEEGDFGKWAEFRFTPVK